MWNRPSKRNDVRATTAARAVAHSSGAWRTGLLLFLGAMLLVALGSAFVLAQRLTQPVEQSPGTIVQMDERRPGLNRAIYGLTFESEMGEQMFLRLRNQGRILPYLQQRGTDGSFMLNHRNGQVISLTDEAESVTIEEREAPTALYGATLVLALAALLLTGHALRGGWLDSSWLLGAGSEQAPLEAETGVSSEGDDEVSEEVSKEVSDEEE